MQLRVRGIRIQLLRSEYDPDKKRCIQKNLGTVPAWESSSALSALDKLPLTEEERQEVIKYWSDQEARSSEAKKKGTVLRAADTILTIAETIEKDDSVTLETALKIQEAVEVLKKVLRKRGAKKKLVQGTKNATIDSE